MGVYKKLSLAYLMKNKIRTLLLILAVSLGVVLIFGTSIINDSKYQNDLKVINKVYGGYHVELNDMTFDESSKLSSEDISDITTIQNLGNIVDENGNSFLLRSANEDYISKKSGKLIEGRLPENNNEIVMQKEALDAMNMSTKLNSKLEFTIKKQYKDSDNEYKTYEKSHEFKLVGVTESPKGYYDFFDINIPFEAFTYGYEEGDKIFPKEIISYNSLLKLNSGHQRVDSTTYKIMEENNLKDITYSHNMPYIRQLTDNQIEMESPNQYKRDALIILTAGIFVFNIFNITLNEIIKEMGLLRLIGSSKKNIRFMIIYQALIIMILGTMIGIVCGLIFSYIGINKLNGNIYTDVEVNPQLYVSNISIMKAIITGVFSVLISCIGPIIKVGNISSVEAVKKSDTIKNYKTNNKFNNFLSKVFGFYGFMGLKNIGRNKVRAFISILSISLGGYIYLTTFSSMNSEGDEKVEKLHEKYDVSISFGVNSDIEVGEYTDEDINNLKNIDGVKNVDAIKISEGLFENDKYNMNEEFMKLKGIDENQMEHSMNLKFYEDDYINNDLINFVEDGNIEDLSKETDNYPNVAIYNSFHYSDSNNTFDDVFEDIKVGDIIDIKVPIIKNNETTYIKSKARVSVMLSPDWMGMGDGNLGKNFEIITSNNHSKVIVGNDKYTKLGINLDNPYDEKINKKVKEVSNNIHLSQFDSRLEFNKMNEEARKNYIKSQMSMIVLVLLIAAINIFCTIRTNLLTRKKELSTLRALGMSSKNMKKMIIYEALTYSVLSFVVALMLSTNKLLKLVDMYKVSYKNYGIENFMDFTFPLNQALIFLVVSILICYLAVTSSNKTITNMSIVDGIRDND